MTAVEERALSRPRTESPALRQSGRLIRAPFSLRCGALLIDYIALVSIVAFSTLISRMLGGGARMAGGSAETLGSISALLVAVLDLGVLPGLTGLTVGKWATGLRIERTNGAELGISRALLRHFVGYPVSFLPLGMGFLLAALMPRGRALHDLIAGTIVVRETTAAPARSARLSRRPRL